MKLLILLLITSSLSQAGTLTVTVTEADTAKNECIENVNWLSSMADSIGYKYDSENDRSSIDVMCDELLTSTEDYDQDIRYVCASPACDIANQLNK